MTNNKPVNRFDPFISLRIYNVIYRLVQRKICCMHHVVLPWQSINFELEKVTRTSRISIFDHSRMIYLNNGLTSKYFIPLILILFSFSFSFAIFATFDNLVFDILVLFSYSFEPDCVESIHWMTHKLWAIIVCN